MSSIAAAQASMIATPRDPAAVTPDSEAPLEWTFNPWRERPAAAAAALVVSLVALSLVVASGIATLAGLAVWAAFTLALHSLLMPVRCRMDGVGAARRGPFGWQRREWSLIGRARTEAEAVWLSPSRTPGRLDAYRSLALPLPRAERETLKVDLARRLARHGL